MTRKILLAGLLGAVAMFAWTSIAHMVLPLGEAGINQIPNDADLMNALHAKLGDAHGFYMYPSMSANQDMSAYAAKLTSNPSGLLIYHPPGQRALTPGKLIIEFLTELAEALLLAWILAQTVFKTYASRVGFALVCGITAAIATNISYWNWYGFPTSYTISYMFTEIAGFLAAGVVAARVIRSA